MVDGASFGEFWDQEPGRAGRSYVELPVTDALVAGVERDLGFKLPGSYVALMRAQNGGIPRRTCFPIDSRAEYDQEYIEISGFLGIGRIKPLSLLGPRGSQFMQREWGYPAWGVCICTCPSGGHDVVMLDYRENGASGEPSVVYVTQGPESCVVALAPNFEAFARGLRDEEDFDDSAEVRDADTASVSRGSFSSALASLLREASGTVVTEPGLRALLRAIVAEKGYLALHPDPLSELVYDALFDLYATVVPVSDPNEFIPAFKRLIFICDGDVRLHGFSALLLENWVKDRTARHALVSLGGRYVLSHADRDALSARLVALQLDDADPA